MRPPRDPTGPDGAGAQNLTDLAVYIACSAIAHLYVLVGRLPLFGALLFWSTVAVLSLWIGTLLGACVIRWLEKQLPSFFTDEDDDDY